MGEHGMMDGSLALKKRDYHVITIEPTKKPAELKLRVAAYARVSSDSDDQENSFGAQTRYYTELITKKSDWALVDIYADEGITGTSTEKREDFKRLMADCHRGLVDRILVKSISRFARNTTECLSAIRDLKQLGISVYFEKENIDTATVSSELMTAVFASFAQQESESISGNMSWAWQKRMEAGTFVPNSQPFGYAIEDGKIVVLVPQAVQICKIFSLYLAGWSTLRIAKHMAQEQEQHPELQAIKWTYKGITRILKNEKYTGNSLWQKRFTTDTFPHKKVKNRGERQQYYAEGTHPAIIDQVAYDRVQQLLVKQTRFKCPTSEAENSPLRSKMVCGHCGCFLRRKVVRGTAYRTCRDREDGDTECTLLPIQERAVEDAFLRLYYNLKHSHIMEQMLADLRIAQERRMLWREDVIELNKRISDLSSQNQMMATLKQQGLIDPDIFIAQTDELAQKLRDTKLQKERIISSSADRTLTLTEELVETIAAGPDYLSSLDPEIFGDIVERITVDDNEHIRFRLRNGLELPETIERTIR